MANITTRSGGTNGVNGVTVKGTPLNTLEQDNNYINLNQELSTAAKWDVTESQIVDPATGAAFLRGKMITNQWFICPSIFRLRMTGTGSVQFDSRNTAGVITPVATYTLTGATDQIEFPYAGDKAVSIRAIFTGDITVEVI